MYKINKYFAFFAIIVSLSLCFQANGQSVSDLYTQRASAIQTNNSSQLQLVDQQLIELNERPTLVYTRTVNANKVIYSFVPAFDYTATQMTKINSRLKSIYPKLLDVIKLNTLQMQVIVENDIDLNQLKDIFLIFRFTYNP